MGDNGNIKSEYLARLQAICEGMSVDSLKLILWFARFLVEQTKKPGA